MKKSLFILIFVSFSIFAQDAGKTGLSFLKLGFGARNIALSDLGVVGVNDVTSLNYNPALLTSVEKPQIMFTHNEYIQDTRSEAVGANFSLWGLPFAVGVNTTSIDEIEVRTKPGEAESTFNANYFFSSLSTGFEVYDNLSFGLTAKFIHESMLTYKSDGYGFDFGLHYTNLIEGLDLGASLRNIGKMDEFDQESTELPTDLRIGAAYDLDLGVENSDLMLIGGFQKYTESENNHIHVGAEYLFRKMIALRAGYLTGHDSKSYTAGFGVNYYGINFDYGFMPFDYDLGSSHILSLQYSFN